MIFIVCVCQLWGVLLVVGVVICLYIWRPEVDIGCIPLCIEIGLLELSNSASLYRQLVPGIFHHYFPRPRITGKLLGSTAISVVLGFQTLVPMLLQQGLYSLK